AEAALAASVRTRRHRGDDRNVRAPLGAGFRLRWLVSGPNCGLDGHPSVSESRFDGGFEVTTSHSVPRLLLQIPGTGSKAGSVPGECFRAPDANDLCAAPSIGTFAVEDDLVGLLYRCRERPDSADSFDVLRPRDVRPQGSRSSSGNCS